MWKAQKAVAQIIIKKPLKVLGSLSVLIDA